MQTLNEEACEDVLEETDDSKTQPVSLPLPLPESEPGEPVERLFADYTCISVEPDEPNNNSDNESFSF